jgi:hypothetical protein
MISELNSSFQKFKASQVNAVLAIKEVALIDSDIAIKLFALSHFDVLIIKQLKEKDLIKTAKKNSQLFTFITPETSDVEYILKGKILASFKCHDEDIKIGMLSYARAQRSAILNIKRFLDKGEKLIPLCFDISQKSIDFIKYYDEDTLIDLADKFSWFLRMNYSKRDDIFYESAELLNQHNHFVESTLNYVEKSF